MEQGMSIGTIMRLSVDHQAKVNPIITIIPDDSSLLVLLLETHPTMWSTLGQSTNGLDAWRFLQQVGC